MRKILNMKWNMPFIAEPNRPNPNFQRDGVLCWTRRAILFVWFPYRNQ